MKTTFLTGFLLMCACTLAAQSQPNTKTISVEVTNSWSKDKSDAPVVLKIKDLQPGFRVRSAVVMNGSEEIPSQLDDLNGDLKANELAFVENFFLRLITGITSPLRLTIPLMYFIALGTGTTSTCLSID